MGTQERIRPSSVKRLTIPGADEEGAFTGDLDITNGNLTILGVSGTNVAIDATGLGDRVFHVFPGSQLMLSNVVVSGGNGGGIYSTNQMTLNRCTVSGNATGAGGTGGDAEQFDSGGQTGGSGGSGAGIYNAGELALDACTVSGNLTGAGGLGGSVIGASKDGGAGGACGSIVQGSQTGILGSAGPDGLDPDVAGAFNSQGYNLIGQAGASTGLTNGSKGDRLGTSAAPRNPLLGPLQDNGGLTPTHALQAGSPALDQGSSHGLATDQRGRPRPHDYGSIPNAAGGDGSDTT